ncbi:hypothetical protein ACHAWF_009187 [Thalassiosira exigua]
MLATVVTPERPRGSKCQERSATGSCGCWKAQFSQNCQSCHKRIRIDDCITHDICGWTHTECPIGCGEERGLRSIEAGFACSVDYSQSLLDRSVDGIEEKPLPLPLRLEFDDVGKAQGEATNLVSQDADDLEAKRSRHVFTEDSKSKVDKINAKKRAKHGLTKSVAFDFVTNGTILVSQGVDEEIKSGGDDNKSKDAINFTHDVDTEKKTSKGGDEHGCHEVAHMFTESKDQYTMKMTKEQMDILSHKPEVGDVVVVNALAGCAKTTTIAWKCNRIQTDEDWKQILYIVFNSSMREEAMQSNKFPKSNMEIHTSHSYVLRYFFGLQNMMNVDPVGDYKLEDIVNELDLRTYCIQKFGVALRAKGERALERRISTLSGYIKRIVNKFQSSEDRTVKEKHVLRRIRESKTKRTEWRKEISMTQYVLWANQFFRAIWRDCLAIKNGERAHGADISHDGYLKVAQLENLQIPHDWLFIDEAQDMSACQAALFWGQRQRANKITFLVGDKYQQIYRFRGASDSFREKFKASELMFTLTGSFRFGKSIASCATCVLKALGGETLRGRSNDPGRVEAEVCGTPMKRSVVLCRSQNGIFNYLLTNKPARWCLLGGKTKLEGPKNIHLVLESFIQGIGTGIKHGNCADSGGDHSDCNDSDGGQSDFEGSESRDPQDESNKGDSNCNVSDSEDADCEDSFRFRQSSAPFTYRGDTFQTLNDIEEYIEDEGDIELCRALNLVKILVPQNKSIEEFFSEIRDSFNPMLESESPENYDGIVLATVHKAKGLEFSCPVLIIDDFKFIAITKAGINRNIHCDEANILYVAITRAKHHLILSQEVIDCLQTLSNLSQVRVKLPSFSSLASSREKVASWQCQWDSFVTSSNPIEKLDDIPYPPDWSDDQHPLALHDAMSVSEQRKLLRGFLRAYHPDKFLSRFGKRILSETVCGASKKVIEEITRTCAEILDTLQSDDGD